MPRGREWLSQTVNTAECGGGLATVRDSGTIPALTHIGLSSGLERCGRRSTGASSSYAGPSSSYSNDYLFLPAARSGSGRVGPCGAGINSKAVLDLLSGLVTKSLVLTEPQQDGSLRYRLLENVRQRKRSGRVAYIARLTVHLSSDMPSHVWSGTWVSGTSTSCRGHMARTSAAN